MSPRSAAAAGGILAALTLSAAAPASTWGGRPSDGIWSGGGASPAKFRVAAGGTEIRDAVLHVPYRCAGSGGGPTRGSFRLKIPKPIAIQPTGWIAIVKVRFEVPGVRGAHSAGTGGLFSSHHPIPPPANTAEFSLSGGFTRNDGSECSFGSSGEARWILHPR
ncbi:MAG TPA: hypothetical protein VG518_06370 [Solirubrobacterales bacterium]|nr:hypothetical protein [Solirubrobacterales bacterium]